jgi:hypothetical protein
MVKIQSLPQTQHFTIANSGSQPMYGSGPKIVWREHTDGLHMFSNMAPFLILKEP